MMKDNPKVHFFISKHYVNLVTARSKDLGNDFFKYIFLDNCRRNLEIMSLKSPALFLLNDYARLYVGHSEKASMSKMSQKYSEFAFSNV